MSEVAQSCPTLCDPVDCSPPRSSVHGIFQARVLECSAIAFSERSQYVESKGLGFESWFYLNCFSFLPFSELFISSFVQRQYADSQLYWGLAPQSLCCSKVNCILLLLLLFCNCSGSIYILGINPFSDILFTVQFSSVAQSCPTLCNPMNRSTPGLHVYHQLPEFIQIHVHQVSDAIQPSHPLSSPSPPAPNPSQHQSLFQWVNSSHEVAKVLEFHL